MRNAQLECKTKVKSEAKKLHSLGLTLKPIIANCTSLIDDCYQLLHFLNVKMWFYVCICGMNKIGGKIAYVLSCYFAFSSKIWKFFSEFCNDSNDVVAFEI